MSEQTHIREFDKAVYNADYSEAHKINDYYDILGAMGETDQLEQATKHAYIDLAVKHVNEGPQNATYEVARDAYRWMQYRSAYLDDMQRAHEQSPHMLAQASDSNAEARGFESYDDEISYQREIGELIEHELHHGESNFYELFARCESDRVREARTTGLPIDPIQHELTTAINMTCDALTLLTKDATPHPVTGERKAQTFCIDGNEQYTVLARSSKDGAITVQSLHLYPALRDGTAGLAPDELADYWNSPQAVIVTARGEGAPEAMVTTDEVHQFVNPLSVLWFAAVAEKSLR